MTVMASLSRPRASKEVTARLQRMLSRLTATPAVVSGSIDDLLNTLEREVDEVVRVKALSVRETRTLHAAIVNAPAAVAVFDQRGVEIVRSSAANSLISGGLAAVLPMRVLQGLVAKASATNETEHEMVEVFGPPRRSLSLYAVPFSDSASDFRSTVAVVEDVTERQLANAARRDLVTNISHELRTPVGAVALLAETLADEQDPEVIRHLASRLELEAQRLTATLQDVLSLSRLEEARSSERQDLNFGELVKFCVGRLRHNAELVGISLEIERLDRNVTVHGDRLLLMRAVDNLVENAVKYSDKGEPVRIRVKSITRPEGSYAELSVQDGGIGIPQRERHRIFERFYRVDRARSRDTGGSGLGLAIVRHVAVSHDGHVDVESAEGVGSTFTFRIPLVHHEQASSTALPGDTPHVHFPDGQSTGNNSTEQFEKDRPSHE